MTTSSMRAAYILVWPGIALAVMIVIICATLRDTRRAQREGLDVV